MESSKTKDTPTPTPGQSSQPLICKIEGHDCQPLNLVCTLDSCPKNGLICADCMSTSHMNHINKCISLQVYVSRIKKSYLVSKEDKEKKIKDFHKAHEENLKLLSNLLTKVNSLLEELSKSEVNFINQANPELEKLITEDKEGLLENLTKLEKKAWGGSDDSVNEFVKSLIQNYSVDSSAGSELIQKTDEKTLKTIDLILKDSKYNIDHTSGFLKQVESSINQCPKLRPFRGKKVINLKNMFKKDEINEPTGMLVLENTLTYIQELGAIVTGNKNGDINVRDFKTGKLLNKMKDSSVSSVYYVPEIKKLFSGNQELGLRIWDGTTFKQEHTFTGLKDMVLSYAYLKGSNILLTGDGIGYLYLWDLTQKQLIKSVEVHRKNWVKCVLLLQQGDHVATSGSDNYIRIWKLTDKNSNVEKVREIKNLENVGKMILFENDNLIYGASGKVGIINWKTGEVVKVLNHSQKWNIVGLHYQESEAVLLSCGNGDNKIKAWTRGTWEQESEFDTGNGICSALVIDDEGYWIVTYGNNKIIILKEELKE